MIFKEVFQTKNVWNWKNTCDMIVLHHTATPPWTTKWNLNVLLWKTSRLVSAHYLVDDLWDIYKLANDSDITFHAWDSSWKWRNNLNRFAIWIEIVWPWFTDKQRKSVEELAKYLIEKYWISKDNVVRHKDIAPKRKNDVDDSFWSDKFKTWDEYKNNLFSKKETMSKYTELMNNVIKETWFTPLFNSHEWDAPLTEKETKELFEIAFARFAQRLSK